jgi:hypothetical protein
VVVFYHQETSVGHISLMCCDITIVWDVISMEEERVCGNGKMTSENTKIKI